MAGIGFDEIASVRVPEIDGAVLAASQEVAAVNVEAGCMDRTLVTLQGVLQLLIPG
jgi:hypothetical protein